MKYIIAIVLVLVLLVQYRIWVGKDSLADVWQLQQAVQTQREENEQLRIRNERLAAEVRDLKQGLAAIETRARKELGMLRKDETLYQFTGK